MLSPRRPRTRAADQAPDVRRRPDAGGCPSKTDRRSSRPPETDSEGLDELLGSDARERIMRVKRGLKEIAVMLAKTPRVRTAPLRGASSILLIRSRRLPAERRRRSPSRPLQRRRRNGSHRTPTKYRLSASLRASASAQPSIGSDSRACDRESYLGMWRSLVAHLTGGQGVAGSNPVIPTNSSLRGLFRSHG